MVKNRPSPLSESLEFFPYGFGDELVEGYAALGCGYRGVEMIADCPNVYVDTSGGQPEDGFLQYAVRRIGADRLLYGSDAPCRDFGCQLNKVLDAGLPADILEKILWTNAVELLK